ncbi:hypothetical protein M6C35_001960 [Vibrio metschnikovii]|nr:hypothetical protein [Vibrio metschnikovii]
MAKHVVEKAYLQNKPLTKFEKCGKFIGSDSVVWLYGISILSLLILPFLFPLIHLVIHLIIYFKSNERMSFPYFAPVSSGEIMDLFNPSPAKDKEGNVRYLAAAGIAYFGNLYGTNEQVWFSNSMLRQHCAFLATTGSGKTFTITSMASGNALIWGAGYAYIDAKADLDIIRMHQSMMWRTNRIDDLFILNYIRGARDRYAYASDRTTNTYNLLETGSASQNTETMKSLMDGDGDIWAKRADSLLSSILRPTHYMRDMAMINLSIPALLDYLVIETAGSLLSREDIPEEHKKELLGFIKTLPGMSSEFFNKISQGQSVQSPQVYDQWGFASMQIILVINTLSGDYGDIFGVTRGEIDMQSIVLQDRILLGLLPALEGSTESVAAMGRIIMAARKGVMGQSLGELFVGSVQENLKNRATNAPYPYIQVLDEVGMMFSKGEGAVAAQARGLGYSIWYSAQDVPAMKKLGDDVAKEVDTVMGNTMIKVAGKIIDDDTFTLFNKLADQQFVWQRDSMDIDYNPSNGTQRQKESRATYQQEDRLDRREVMKLREGEIIINAVDRLHRVDGPNLHPKSLKTLTINDFWMMLPYASAEIEQLNNEWVYLTSEFNMIVSGEQKLNDVPSPALQDLKKINDILTRSKRVMFNPSDACTLAFSAYIRTNLEEMRGITAAKSDYYEHVSQMPPASVPIKQRLQDETVAIASAKNTSNDSDSMPGTLFPFPIDGGAEVNASKNDAVSINRTIPPGNESNVNDTFNSFEIEDTDSLEDLHALDLAFKTQGVTREDTVVNLAKIAALSARAGKLKNDLERGSISKHESHEAMSQPLSKEEVNTQTTNSASTVSNMYAKTIHPTDPKPVRNKELTLSILKRIKTHIESA